MNKRRLDRMTKISRLIPGGFDGTFGSEEHNASLNIEPEDRHFQDLSEMDHFEDRSGFVPFSMVPYDTEGIDEDINVYILDKGFFGNGEKENLAAINAINMIFDTKNSSKDSTYLFEGIRNSSVANRKIDVLDSIRDVYRLSLLRPDSDIGLSESQLYYLEHLEESIIASEIPFFLYIFD